MVRVDLRAHYQRTTCYTIPLLPWRSHQFTLVNDDTYALYARTPIEDPTERWIALVSLRNGRVAPLEVPSQPSALKRAEIMDSAAGRNAPYILAESDKTDGDITMGLFRYDEGERLVEFVALFHPVTRPASNNAVKAYWVSGIIDEIHHRMVQLDDAYDAPIQVTARDLYTLQQDFSFRVTDTHQWDLSPDGRLLAALDPTGQISLWDLNARGKPHSLILINHDEDGKPWLELRCCFSPSSRYLVVAAHNSDEISVYDLRGQDIPMVHLVGIDRFLDVRQVLVNEKASQCIIVANARRTLTAPFIPTDRQDVMLIYDLSMLEDF